LKPSHHISQKPPTSANGTESMTIRVSVAEHLDADRGADAGREHVECGP
jgi:hypothetical protein